MKLHERLAEIMASKLEMSSKMVLTVLASHMSDDEGRPVWPSVETIAAMAGGSKQVVSMILTKLEARGIVVVTAHAVPGRSTARRAIDWEALASASRDSRPQPAKPGTRTDDRTLQGPATEPCKDRSPNPAEFDDRTLQGPVTGRDQSIRTVQKIPPKDPSRGSVQGRGDLTAQLAALESAPALPTEPTEPEQVRGSLPVASTAGEGGGRLNPDTPTGGTHESPIHDQQASRPADHPAPAAQAPHEIAAAQNRTPGAADPRAADPRGQAPAGQDGGPPGVGAAHHQPGGGVDVPPDLPVAPPGPDPVGAADSPLGAEAGLFGPGPVRPPDRPVEPRARVRGRRTDAAAPAGRDVAAPTPARVDHLADGSAWLRCVAWWLEICPPPTDTARLPKPYTPNDSRGGGELARSIVKVGADFIALRFEYLATAPTAQHDREWIRDEAIPLLSLAWQGGSRMLQRIDAAAAEWAERGRPLQIERNGPSRASGGPAHGLSARERQEADRRATMQALDRIARGGEDVIDATPDALLLGGA